MYTVSNKRNHNSNDTTVYSQDLSTTNQTIYHIRARHQWKTLPMATIWIDKRQVQALLDSGSEINLIQEDVAKMLEHQKNVSRINNNNPIKIECGGKISMSEYLLLGSCFKLKERSYTASFHVVNISTNVPKMILGIPWLREHGIILNFEQNAYSIMDQGGKIIDQVNNDTDYKSNFQQVTDNSSYLTQEHANSNLEDEGHDKVDNSEITLPPELSDLAIYVAKPDYKGKLKESDFKTFIEFEKTKPNRMGTPGYPIPQAWLTQAKKQMQVMVDQGVVEEVNGYCNYVSPGFFIRKRDTEELRLVINYRTANQYVIGMESQLPSIYDSIVTLPDSAFTVLDITSAFYTVKLDKLSQDFLCFKVGNQTYRPLRAPMGYKNSAQLFAAFINHILSSSLKPHLTIYVDDLLIIGKPNTIVSLTREVIQHLGGYGIRFSAKKIQFNQRSIEYLGYKIVPGGIKPLERHIEAIVNLPPPQTVRDVRSLIGMANFIRNWIPNISESLKHMYQTIKDYGDKGKKGRISISEELILEYQNFKETLQRLPTIGRFIPGYPILIFTDASRYSTGAVVIQLSDKADSRKPIQMIIDEIKERNGKVQGKILGFSSYKLTPAEQNYSVYDLELLAIDKVLEQYEQWLIGSPVTVITDHANLSRLTTKVRLTPRISRTMEFLMQFDVRIGFMEGDSNTMADGLSRYPIHKSSEPSKIEVELFRRSKLRPEILEPSIPYEDTEIPNQVKRLFITTAKINESDNVFLRVPEMTLEIVEKYQEDQIHDITGLPITLHDKLKEAVSNIKVNSKLHFLTIQGDKLLTKEHKWWIPQEQYEIILWIIWNTHINNDMHRGIQETLRCIRKRYNFDDLYKLTQVVVNSCKICQSNKPTNFSISNYRYIPTPSRPHMIMSADHITDLDTSKDGYNEILVIVDLFTRYTYLIAAKKQDTAEETFQRLEEKLCLHGGLPITMLTDNGTKFKGEFNKNLSWRGINHWNTSIYRAKSNGANERMNGIIKQCLRTHGALMRPHWPQHLSATEFFINSRTHSAIRRSPNELKFGYEPEWIDTNKRLEMLNTDTRIQVMSDEEWYNYIQEKVKPIQALLVKSKDRNKKKITKTGKPVVFKVGEMVWISRHAYVAKGLKALKAVFIGPAVTKEAVRRNIPNKVNILNSSIVLHVNAEFLRKFIKPIDTVRQLRIAMDEYFETIVTTDNTPNRQIK
ncbi:uncharacterized protein NDAI_0A04060 [Naumovozyma dairenensis CBS 421]|uniref:RNA-directed DNA polymerase n=1 Tax=Naumovozyma dairenensis (strain ATCC 10597 / BCRC 20456 / CBS 421 / NBRC 0211 / NRRL Y-12639) TaxID=1071378 RepID=G0W425_NAUDC|nr:hypothetical protein NDAI_0A04060 [Naumovozyma dairenensis CBS 421]CCD22563.1 hypothetical protein NDAI_0A04060 [Naumovozyma dairenensis CBS 421]